MRRTNPRSLSVGNVLTHIIDLGGVRAVLGRLSGGDTLSSFSMFHKGHYAMICDGKPFEPHCSRARLRHSRSLRLRSVNFGKIGAI
jgi:hypothetical protein